MRVVKYILMLCFFLSKLYSQNHSEHYNDSLLSCLKKNIHDTSRIRVYLELAEHVYDPAVWPKYNQKAIDIALKIKNSQDTAIQTVALIGIANGLNNKGYYYNSVGMYDSAMYYYLRSTELMIKSKNKEGSAIVLLNIGLLLNEKGDYVGSIDYYYRSLKIFEKLNNEFGLSQVYNNLASTYNYVNDKDRAREYYYKSIAIKKKINNPVSLSTGYNNLGSFYDKTGGYDSARYYYNKALTIKRKYRDLIGIMNVYSNIGTMYFTQHKYDSTKIYLDKAYSLGITTKNRNGLAYVFNNYALLYEKLGKHKEAEEYVKKSLEISNEEKILKPLITSFGILGNIYKSSKQFEKALYYTERHEKFSDSLINNDKQRSIAVLQIKHDYEKEILADSIRRVQTEIENEFRHQTEIHKQRSFTYIGIASAIFMFFLAMLLLNRYRIKQRSNTLLAEKNEIILKQKETAEEQKLEIEVKQKEILDSITYAKRIQQSLMPTEKYIERNVTKLKPKK